MSSIRDFFPIEYRIGGVKPKKNFIVENKKYVTKLAKSTQVSKENDNPSYRSCCANTQKNKEKHNSNINSVPVNSKKFNLDQIDASIKSIRTAIAQTRITQEKLRIKNHHEKEYFNLKDQATQTVNPYDEKNVLKDSVIRYTKSECTNTVKQIQNTLDAQTEIPKSKCTDFMPKKDSKHVRLQDNNKSKEKQPHLVKLKENVASHHQLGEIPNYLKNRKALKEKNEKEEQKKLAIRYELGLDDPACPSGHILLPETERVDHLAKIKKEYNHMIDQLNMLPMRSDSYKMIEKRKHLEKELDRLQLGIKLFSRNKLFVNVNPKLIKFYK